MFTIKKNKNLKNRVDKNININKLIKIRFMLKKSLYVLKLSEIYTRRCSDKKMQYEHYIIIIIVMIIIIMYYLLIPI